MTVVSESLSSEFGPTGLRDSVGERAVRYLGSALKCPGVTCRSIDPRVNLPWAYLHSYVNRKNTIIECLTDILRGEDSVEARKQSTLFPATREGAVVMAAVLVAAVVMVTVAVGMEDISSLGRGW